MEQTKPLVSVVMPSYNSQAFLLLAVESVRCQTMTDLELIIVDDCSTDRTMELLAAASQSDPRIKVIENETNIGAALSRNRAFEAARGDYIALLDSDDLWKPEKLARQLALAEETGADIVYCSYEMIDEAGRKRWPDFIVPESTDLEQMLLTSVISCSTALLKAEICKKHVFPQNVYHEDYAYWLSLLQAGYMACGVPDVLASYRVRADSRSFNKLRSAARRWSVYREYLGMPLGKSLKVFGQYAIGGLKKYRKQNYE